MASLTISIELSATSAFAVKTAGSASGSPASKLDAAR
jgi:hypothetical protein